MTSRSVFFISMVFFSFCNTYGQVSAAKRVVQYHNLQVPITYQGRGTIVIVGMDNRPMVMDKSQEPDFVGYIRSTAGVPWRLKTLSGNSFMTDFTGLIAGSLASGGFSIRNVTIQNEQELNGILQNAYSEKIDRVVLVRSNDWNTDQYDAGMVAHKRWLHYDIDVVVFMPNGSKVLQKKFAEPAVELSKKGYAVGDYKTFIPETVKIELGKILNDDELKKSLTSGIGTESRNPRAGRIALVIGAKNYQYASPLQNTLNDAHDMSATLRSKGFDVLELYDPQTKRHMQDIVIRYFQQLQNCKSCIGLVFYSGHGMQVDGSNYLIPVQANPQIKADLEDQCLNMDYVMRAIEQAGNPLNIFILDACRNNPFKGFYRSNEQGLSMVATPKGSYIVYATKPGSVASDGTGRNGLFTSKLLKHMNAEGMNIEKVFKLVAADVILESDDKQRPWIASDYAGDFYFTPGKNESQVLPHVSGPALLTASDNKAEENKNTMVEIEPDFGYETGNRPETVTIGTQQWINKNLNVDHFANGDPIAEAKVNSEWEKFGKEGKPAWCFINNDPRLGAEYGKLYNWYAVEDPRGVCPAGWHVATDGEWTEMTDFLGTKEAEQLKATSAWGRKGTNSANFSAMPGGLRASDGEFGNFGNASYWWTSTGVNKEYARLRLIPRLGNDLPRDSNGKQFGYAVRCIKNK